MGQNRGRPHQTPEMFSTTREGARAMPADKWKSVLLCIGGVLLIVLIVQDGYLPPCVKLVLLFALLYLWDKIKTKFVEFLSNEAEPHVSQGWNVNFAIVLSRKGWETPQQMRPPPVCPPQQMRPPPVCPPPQAYPLQLLRPPQACSLQARCVHGMYAQRTKTH